MQIVPGMIVWLKSGGPKMTVKTKHLSNMRICSFFNDNNEYNERHIAEEQLTNTDPNDSIDTRQTIGYRPTNS